VKLAPKTVTLFSALGVALVGGCYLALETAVYPQFEEFERRESATNLSRARDLLEAQRDTIATLGYEYSEWSATYNFILDPNQSFVEANIAPFAGYFHELDIDIIVILDSAGNPVYELAMTPSDGLAVALDPRVRELVIGLQLSSITTDPYGELLAVLDTPSSPLMLASLPVFRSDGSGPSAGRFVFGHYLTPDRILSLGRRASIDLTLESYSNISKSGENRNILQQLQESETSILSVVTESSRIEHQLLFDPLNNPTALLTVTTPRDISAMGVETVTTALVVFAIASFALLIIAWACMQWLIVRPIRYLTDHVASIRDSSDLRLDSIPERPGEVGTLGASLSREPGQTYDTLAGERVLIVDDNLTKKPVRRADLLDALMSAVSGEYEDQVSDAAEESTATPVFCGRQVLLVEDNKVNQLVASQMLTTLGLNATVVSNGQDAVEHFEHVACDLILMDCQMPVMDGFAATRVIREKEAALGRSRTPIVAVTANALQGDRENCIAAGMDDYLSKPFTNSALRAILHKFFCDDEENVSKESEDPATLLVGAGESVVSSAIDPNIFKQLESLEESSGKPFVPGILEAFLDSASELMETLRAALHAEDKQRVNQAAHSLKSSSANVGAIGLSLACKDVETLARNGDKISPTDHAIRIEREYGRVVAALSRELRQREESAA